MSRLLVACGGSGDLVTALAIAASSRQASRLATLALDGDEMVVLAAPVWERLALDPWPGPRGAEGLIGLASVPAGRRITAHTRLPGGYSPLPSLAGMVSMPIMFLDFADGVVGLRRQLERIVHCYRLRSVELVDTGGDALACGDEPGLVSPAADALLLAASAALDCHVQLTCAGLGVDGELSPAELDTLTADIPATSVRTLSADRAEACYRWLSWMPSEASLITLLAASGLHGTVDLNAGCRPVRVDGHTATAQSFPLRPVAARNRFAAAVTDSTSFAEADQLLRAAGARSEYQSELGQAAAAPFDRDWTCPPELGVLLEKSRPRGDYLSLRRIARATGLNSRQGHLRLERMLRHAAGGAFRRPLLRVAPVAPVPNRTQQERS